MAEIVALLALVALVVPVLIHNILVTKRNLYKNAYSQIDVQLKRRYDLIPNLVETAKGYLKHESETLEAVTAARNVAHEVSARAAAGSLDASTLKQLGAAESGLSGALSRLIAVSESYPDLKANQNMMLLSEELTSTENRIAFARQAYNDAVMSYNTVLESFPANIMAAPFGFAGATMFEVADPSQREPIVVKF
jgi:LemA protein